MSWRKPVVLQDYFKQFCQDGDTRGKFFQRLGYCKKMYSLNQVLS